MVILAPDCVAVVMTAVYWCVEGVVCPGHDDEQPGDDGAHFVCHQI
jgi:hypothetical protein